MLASTIRPALPCSVDAIPSAEASPDAKHETQGAASCPDVDHTVPAAALPSQASPTQAPGPQPAPPQTKIPLNLYVKGAGGVALALAPIALQSMGALVKTNDTAYNSARERLQTVADRYASRLGIEAPRVMIHRSWPTAAPYQGADYPTLGLYTISLGKKVIDTHLQFEQDCWLGHEMGHFCEGKDTSCLLPSDFVPYGAGQSMLQRELSADYLGAMLCGSDNFFETMRLAQERDVASGKWTRKPPFFGLKVFEGFETHPSFAKRMDTISRSSGSTFALDTDSTSYLKSMAIFYGALSPIAALIYFKTRNRRNGSNGVRP
jgi:hypothetical protein